MVRPLTPASNAVPRPRSPQLDLDAPVPRYWFGGNALATHLANGVNLLFPAGERFFVRSVHHYMNQIDDPSLRARVQGFSGQEGRHAKEHERFFRQMEAQGFDVERFLALYNRIGYEMIERVAPPSLRLATTAACEHFTAIMAEMALRRRIIDHAHPTMRALLLWHAAEEIEHRSVAYDVLMKINPGYGLRVAGLAMASACLAGFWVMAAVSLIRQDKDFKLRQLHRDWQVVKEKHVGRNVFFRGIREYLRRDFHPSQADTDSLAADYLGSAGLA